MLSNEQDLPPVTGACLALALLQFPHRRTRMALVGNLYTNVALSQDAVLPANLWHLVQSLAMFNQP